MEAVACFAASRFAILRPARLLAPPAGSRSRYFPEPTRTGSGGHAQNRRSGQGGRAVGAQVHRRALRPPDVAPDLHRSDRLSGADHAGGGACDDPRSRPARGRNEISIEAHDVLLGNLRAYLGDKAAEQQRTLDELEDAVRNGGNR